MLLSGDLNPWSRTWFANPQMTPSLYDRQHRIVPWHFDDHTRRKPDHNVPHINPEIHHNPKKGNTHPDSHTSPSKTDETLTNQDEELLSHFAL